MIVWKVICHCVAGSCLSLCCRLLFAVEWYVVDCRRVVSFVCFLAASCCMSLCGRFLFVVVLQVVVCHSVAGCCL